MTATSPTTRPRLSNELSTFSYPTLHREQNSTQTLKTYRFYMFKQERILGKDFKDLSKPLKLKERPKRIRPGRFLTQISHQTGGDSNRENWFNQNILANTNYCYVNQDGIECYLPSELITNERFDNTNIRFFRI